MRQAQRASVQHFVVGDREPRAVVDRAPGCFLYHFAATDVVDQLEFLAPEPPPEDRAKALLKRRLEDVVLIGIDRALHDVFSQSECGVDQHYIAESGLGVEREHHPRSRQIRADHPLHADRERDLQMIEALAR